MTEIVAVAGDVRYGDITRPCERFLAEKIWMREIDKRRAGQPASERLNVCFRREGTMKVVIGEPRWS